MILKSFSPHKPKEIFDKFAPPKFVQNLLRAFLKEYRSPREIIRREGFEKPETRDLIPYLRRTCLETALVNVARRQRSDAITVHNGANLRMNSHRIIVCGPVWITQSKVEHKYELPRQAIFRKTYAQQSQLYMFEVNPEADTNAVLDAEGDILYAILVHRASKNIWLPEFVDVIFPDSQCKTIVDRIELFERYPDIVNGLVDAPSDTPRPPLEGLKIRTKDVPGIAK